MVKPSCRWFMVVAHGNLSHMFWYTDREFCGGVYSAEQNLCQRSSALISGIPGLNHSLGPVIQFRNRAWPAILQNQNHRFSNIQNPFGQLHLDFGEANIHAVKALSACNFIFNAIFSPSDSSRIHTGSSQNQKDHIGLIRHLYRLFHFAGEAAIF